MWEEQEVYIFWVDLVRRNDASTSATNVQSSNHWGVSSSRAAAIRHTPGLI